MRRNGLILGGLLVCGAALLAGASADHHNADGAKPAETALPKCPVMAKEAVDFNVRSMTPEGPIYYCCPGCIRKVEKDPAKYAEAIAAQRAALAKLERVQVACPVSGEPLDGKTSAKVGDQTVGFCCPKCVAAYEKEPAKYSEGMVNAYTYQTKCPVEGKKIDPAASGKLPTGETVYFCCKECTGKFMADPLKYADAMAAQGYPLDAKKLKTAMEKSTQP